MIAVWESDISAIFLIICLKLLTDTADTADWDALSLESDQSVQGSTHSSEDFTDCDQPRRYDSCCFRSYEASSLPSIIDFSYGFLSKGLK